MTNKYLKKYLASTAIGEMQIKPIMKYHCPSRMATIENIVTSSIEKDVGQSELPHVLGGNVKLYSPFGKVSGSFV